MPSREGYHSMPSKYKHLLFPFLLVFYEISTYLSNDMYLPALPQMMQDLSITAKQAQLTITMWFLGSAGMPLFMGILSDRFGRRSVLLGGGLLYIAATFFCAIATNGSTLLIARLFEGAAIPSMLIAGYACIHELYDTKEAIKILALMGSITVLAPALGPLLGSFILLVTSWRGIFYFILVWAIIAIALLFQFMPEPLPKDQRVPINIPLIMQQYARVLFNKKFILFIFVFGFLFAGFIVWISAGPLLVIEGYGYSPMVFGWIQAGVFTVYIIANRLVKYFIEWYGSKQLIWGGLHIALFGAMLGLILALLYPHNLWLFLIGMTTYSFGAALSSAPLNRTIIEASDQPMGVRMSLFTVIWTLFIVIGSLIPATFLTSYVSSVAIPIAIMASLAYGLMFLSR